MSRKDINTVLGPLAALYHDPNVSEIMVDGPQHVTVEHFRNGAKIDDTDIRFNSDDEVISLIKEAVAYGGVEFEDGKTIYDLRLSEDGRMAAVLPPTALRGPSLIIRKFMTNPITWEMLIHYGSITATGQELLKRAIEARANILISGGTASGKTTFANRVAELIPPEERVVVVEQVHEMQIDLPRIIYLEANGPVRVSMDELLFTGSIMRPDRLIVGELNGAEALRAMQIFGHGHDGGLTTIHATNCENALARLEAMCLMANLGLGLDDIRQMIVGGLKLLCHQERLSNGKRKIIEIVELRGLENGRYVLQPLMRYNPDTDQLEATGAKPSWE